MKKLRVLLIAGILGASVCAVTACGTSPQNSDQTSSNQRNDASYQMADELDIEHMSIMDLLNVMAQEVEEEYRLYNENQ